MSFEHDYNKMRPYKDNEVKEALSRVLKDDIFKTIVSYLYEGEDSSNVIESFRSIETVADFQATFSRHAVNEIIRKTSDGLTYSGLENLDANTSYLFISNHRDIVLDSAIMQVLLFEASHRTSQITFGSNLMTSKLIVDIGKLNKMFTFYRAGSRIQMYKDALLHSQYIKKVITEENESVWIAQRDGRTKDGNDKTQESLIKMLTMGKEDPFEALLELNIVPVSISYEYEPCDAEKVQELYISKSQKYKKQKNEDLNSVLSGIKNQKGSIHMAFCNPINPVIEKCKNKKFNLNALTQKVVADIDKQIRTSYKLRAINYIAYDLYQNNNAYLNLKYTRNEQLHFIEYINKKVQFLNGNKNELRKMFISMYATPVGNAVMDHK